VRAEVAGAVDVETACDTCSWLFCRKPCDATQCHASWGTVAAVVTFPWADSNATEKLTVELYQ